MTPISFVAQKNGHKYVLNAGVIQEYRKHTHTNNEFISYFALRSSIKRALLGNKKTSVSGGAGGQRAYRHWWSLSRQGNRLRIGCVRFTAEESAIVAAWALGKMK